MISTEDDGSGEGEHDVRQFTSFDERSAIKSTSLNNARAVRPATCTHTATPKLFPMAPIVKGAGPAIGTTIPSAQMTILAPTIQAPVPNAALGREGQ